MELKKLTAKEIIDILIENTDLSNFDEGICSTNEPKGFVPSEELAEKIKLNKKGSPIKMSLLYLIFILNY